MSQKLTDKACKAIIIQVAKKLNVEAKLITTRLMDEQDKEDMRNGLISIEALECHVAVWKQNGLCDYAHGKDTPLRYEH